MDWIQGIQRALDYVEANITEEIDPEEAAKRAYSSFFTFKGYSEFYAAFHLAIISVCEGFLLPAKNCRKAMPKFLTSL